MLGLTGCTGTNRSLSQALELGSVSLYMGWTWVWNLGTLLWGLRSRGVLKEEKPAWFGKSPTWFPIISLYWFRFWLGLLACLPCFHGTAIWFSFKVPFAFRLTPEAFYLQSRTLPITSTPRKKRWNVLNKKKQKVRTWKFLWLSECNGRKCPKWMATSSLCLMNEHLVSFPGTVSACFCPSPCTWSFLIQRF